MPEVHVVHTDQGRLIRFPSGQDVLVLEGRRPREVRHLGRVPSQETERIQAGPAYTPDDEPHAIELPWEQAGRPIAASVLTWGFILFVSFVVGYAIGAAL